MDLWIYNLLTPRAAAGPSCHVLRSRAAARPVPRLLRGGGSARWYTGLRSRFDDLSVRPYTWLDSHEGAAAGDAGGVTMAQQLRDGEARFYRTFGFLQRHGALSDAEVATLRNELEQAHARRYRPPLGEYVTRELEPMLRLESPFAASLPEDERFGGVAEQLQGPSYLCAVNSYVLRGNTSWHPDFERDVGEFGQCDGLVMAVYLEPLDGSSGALRVLPGSHVNPFHADVFDEVQSAALPFGGAAAEWPCHICACQPNDIVIWNSHIWHASLGGGNRRTALMMSIDKSPVTTDAVGDHRQRLEAAEAGWGDEGRPGEDLHPAWWLANGGGNVRRARWVKELRRIRGDSDTPACASGSKL